MTTYQIKEEIYADIREICLRGFDAHATPWQLMNRAWENADFLMHCPEYHYLIPAVLLTA